MSGACEVDTMILTRSSPAIRCGRKANKKTDPMAAATRPKRPCHREKPVWKKVARLKKSMMKQPPKKKRIAPNVWMDGADFRSKNATTRIPTKATIPESSITTSNHFCFWLPVKSRLRRNMTKNTTSTAMTMRPTEKTTFAPLDGVPALVQAPPKLLIQWEKMVKGSSIA